MYVQEGEGFIKRPVVVGLTDFFYAEVQEGLAEGDIVSLEQVADNRDNIRAQAAARRGLSALESPGTGSGATKQPAAGGERRNRRATTGT